MSKKRESLTWFALIVVTIQILCATFFLLDVSMDILHLRSSPQSWTAHEVMEIAAVLGSFFGVICAFLVWRLLRRRIVEMERLTKFLSGNFADGIAASFERWELSESETSVAWGLVKGYSNKEIADMRGTSDGTVKAQTGAVFKKAGVSSRQQFISNFIEDLISQNLEDESK